MTTRPTAPVFADLRIPPQVITAAVRWYLRYGLSYWDVEELLADPSVAVDHVTIYRRVRRFTPEFARDLGAPIRLRRLRVSPGR